MATKISRPSAEFIRLAGGESGGRRGEREGGRGEEIGRQREKRGCAEDLRAEFRGGENGEDGFGRRAGEVR